MTPDITQSPSYLIAAGVHDTVHGAIAPEPEDKGFIESSVDLVTKGVPAALVAAGVEVVNIPTSIGNWFGADIPSVKTRDVIASLDSDWTKYYDNHKLGIDTAGFIAASLLPGAAGVKLTRMAPTVLKTTFGSGVVGKTSAEALGLFANNRSKYLAEAVKQVVEGNAFRLSETNFIRAAVAGIGQNALEGAAATAVINATMYQSPILNQRATSDLMWDVVTGAVLGGAIGGTISGVSALGQVKGAALKAKEAVHGWTIAGLGGTASAPLSTSDKIIYYLSKLDSLPAVTTETEYAKAAGKAAARTQSSLDLKVRGLLGELADGDQDVAGILKQVVDKTTLNKNVSNLYNSEAVVRVGTVTKQEKAIEKALTAISNKKTGSLALDAGDDLVAAANAQRVNYLNLLTGDVTPDAPLVRSLADYGTPEVIRGGVRSGKVVIKTDKFIPEKLDTLTAEAYYLRAERAPKFDVIPGKITTIDPSDIPRLQKATREGITVKVGNVEYSPTELFDYTKNRQAEIAAALKASKPKLSNQEIARIVNADESVLFQGADGADLWNARDVMRKVAKEKGLDIDPTLQPVTLKVITSTKGLEIDGHLVDGLTAVAQKQEIYRTNAKAIAAEGLQEVLPDSAGISIRKAAGVEAGSSFLGAENSSYGSVGSFFGYVGQRTNALKQKAVAAVGERFNSYAIKLANDADSAVEWSLLNEKLRGLPQGYMLADDGTQLIHKQILRAIEDGIDPNTITLPSHVPATIPIKNQLVRDLARQHILENDANRSILSKVHNNNGYPQRVTTGEFYPIPRDPKDTPFFAFVVDKSVNGRGHSQMIYAKDSNTLQKMIDDIISDPDLQKLNLKVLTKTDAEDYYKAVGKFEFERTLSDNYIQTALARKGKSASYLPLTDPSRIAEQVVDWHKQRAVMKVRTLVEHQYADEFATLREMATTSSSAARSKFGYSSMQSLAENAPRDPALNIIRTALDISKIDEYPIWSPLNKFLDDTAGKLYDGIGRVFSKSTSPQHLDEISKLLDEHGWQGREQLTASLYEAMNGKVQRNVLSKVVARANSLLATISLRMDPFNAMNNAVGHSVLLGPETKYVINNVIAGNEKAVGELAALAKIKLPGTDSYILSPAKLIARQINKFHSDTVGREWMRAHGYSTRLHDQYSQVLDDIATAISKGDETFLQKAMTGMRHFGDKAEVWTGNKLAEEFNRYVAAGAMKDITDVAVKHGLMRADDALSYINTFVNRTQGNYLASQRPVIFQGPVGQAIGLFQTYQFNLLQQMFRHISEGQAKNVAIMMGMQSGVYGLNGLPGFNAINTHIIGTAGGNIEHKDMYDAIRSGAGKEAGEWITYGLGANVFSVFHPDLKTNLYTRGDLNPRHFTLVPTDPSKIPVWQMSERFFSNFKQVFSQIGAGADPWPTILSGIEQNGISRPLSGMAAVLGGFASEDGKVRVTNQQGNLLAQHDLLTLTSLMRIAGARPLDEAMMRDTMAGINAYRAHDTAKKEQLGEAIKNTIKDGSIPSQEQVNEFVDKYLRAGGRREEFNNYWVRQYKNVSQTQADKLRAKLRDPLAQKLQFLLSDGDRELEE